jgi:acyl-CoA synthetase (AMP-forming)/AMP-acid ligase II
MIDGASGGFRSLVESIEMWAEKKPDDAAFVLLGDGEQETDRVSFGRLRARARGSAAQLVDRNLAGKPVLISAETKLGFIIAFCACLYSGAIAVPAPLQTRNRGLERLRAIAAHAGLAAVVSPAETAALTADEVLGRLPWLGLEETDEAENDQVGMNMSEGPALLQYTSGSTGAPKAVMLSQQNLVANLEMIRSAVAIGADSLLLTWLPLFHDMGFVNVLMTLHAGIACVLMPPLAFLQRPERWLQAISRYRATISGGPNFAFDRCAARLDRQKFHGIDSPPGAPRSAAPNPSERRLCSVSPGPAARTAFGRARFSHATGCRRRACSCRAVRSAAGSRPSPRTRERPRLECGSAVGARRRTVASSSSIPTQGANCRREKRVKSGSAATMSR